MNNSAGGQPQIAGAVSFGGTQKSAPAHFQVGAVGFGPAWDDDEVQLTHAGWKSVTDRMAASIVRLECEAEELRAEVALLREQARILQAERDEAREAGWKAAMQAVWDRLPMPEYANDPMTPREVAKLIEFVRSQKEAAK